MPGPREELGTAARTQLLILQRWRGAPLPRDEVGPFGPQDIPHRPAPFAPSPDGGGWGAARAFAEHLMLNLLSRLTRRVPEAKASRAHGAVALYGPGRPVWTPRDYGALARE